MWAVTRNLHSKYVKITAKNVVLAALLSADYTSTHLMLKGFQMAFMF